MSDRYFVDTNILIYAYDIDAGSKHEHCKNLIMDLWDGANGVISTQVMQEFYVNITRKIPEPLSLDRARSLLSLYETWQVEIIEAPLVSFASVIQERNRLSFWDALIIATAAQGNVKGLYSEDLNPGQRIEGVEVINPMLP
ncbi:MAG: PIN domain-containing protein [Methylococcaceae bacterium]